MVGSISDADYIVLGYPQSSTYRDLISQTKACNKVPLKNTFVTDCVKQMALLDEESYVLQGFTSKKKQRTSLATVKVETAKVTPKKEPKRSVKKAQSFVRDPTPPPGLTPPPLNTRVELTPGSGKYKYPPEEIAWFKKFARFHVDKDPKISNTELFKLVHQQVLSPAIDIFCHTHR